MSPTKTLKCEVKHPARRLQQRNANESIRKNKYGSEFEVINV